MTSNASPASDRKRPFWKEPMMWVVLGIPLASIVAGVGLVVVSVRSGSADVVMDKVDRVSQIQTTDLGPTKPLPRASSAPSCRSSPTMWSWCR